MNDELFDSTLDSYGDYYESNDSIQDKKRLEEEANYEKERETLINYLYILRQDAEPDFTREYVQNMTNKEIIKEIDKERQIQDKNTHGGLNF